MVTGKATADTKGREGGRGRRREGEGGSTTASQVDYLNSFFFWLDIISTLSLLLDITIAGCLAAPQLRSSRKISRTKDQVPKPMRSDVLAFVSIYSYEQSRVPKVPGSIPEEKPKRRSHEHLVKQYVESVLCRDRRAWAPFVFAIPLGPGAKHSAACQGLPVHLQLAGRWRGRRRGPPSPSPGPSQLSENSGSAWRLARSALALARPARSRTGLCERTASASGPNMCSEVIYYNIA